jgi:hypothetical protein
MMTMNKNPILDELHAVREQLLADAGGTLDALVDRLQAEEQESDQTAAAERRRSSINRCRPVIGNVDRADVEPGSAACPSNDQRWRAGYS